MYGIKIFEFRDQSPQKFFPIFVRNGCEYTSLDLPHAKCMRYGGLKLGEPHVTPSPDKSCNCGYHAYNIHLFKFPNQSGIETISINIQTMFWGRSRFATSHLLMATIVELYGKVIEHESGTRAEYCRIYQLIDIYEFYITMLKCIPRYKQAHSEITNNKAMLNYLENCYKISVLFSQIHEIPIISISDLAHFEN